MLRSKGMIPPPLDIPRVVRETGNHHYSVLHTRPCTTDHAFPLLAFGAPPIYYFFELHMKHTDTFPSIFTLAPLLSLLSLLTPLFPLLPFFSSVPAGHRDHPCYGLGCAGPSDQGAVFYTANNPQTSTMLCLQSKCIP